MTNDWDDQLNSVTLAVGKSLSRHSNCAGLWFSFHAPSPSAIAIGGTSIARHARLAHACLREAHKLLAGLKQRYDAAEQRILMLLWGKPVRIYRIPGKTCKQMNAAWQTLSFHLGARGL